MDCVLQVALRLLPVDFLRRVVLLLPHRDFDLPHRVGCLLLRSFVVLGSRTVARSFLEDGSVGDHLELLFVFEHLEIAQRRSSVESVAPWYLSQAPEVQSHQTVVLDSVAEVSAQDCHHQTVLLRSESQSVTKFS